jgi:hypothetical protein
MTLSTDLHEFLRDEIDVSVHEARLPTRPMMPALVQRFITGSTTQTHSNRVSLVNRRIQIDCYSNNRDKTDDMATRVLLALDGYHGTMGDTVIGWATLIVDTESQPEEIKSGANEVRFRRSLDFALGYQQEASISS